MQSQLRARKIDKLMKSSNQTETTDADSASSPVSGTSLSSSDESKSETEIRKDKKKKTSKRSLIAAGKFHVELWITLTMVFLLLGAGKQFVQILLPTDWLPIGRVNIADFMQLTYNIAVPFCLFKLWENSPRRTSSTVMYIVVIVNIVGSSIALIYDCLNDRLVSFGYDTDLSVRKNPIMKNLKPKQLLAVFELLHSFGKDIGHPLWKLSFFIILLLYFSGCFVEKRHRLAEGIQQLTRQCWCILPFYSLYIWYLTTEYQLLAMFMLTLFLMLFYQLFEQSQHRITDVNGQFLLQSMGITVICLFTWKWLLWGDDLINGKYPGLSGIPQPWMWYRMYVRGPVDGFGAVVDDEVVVSESSPVITVTMPGAAQ